MLDATEATLEFILLALESQAFFLGNSFEAAVLGHLLKLFEALDGLLYGFVIGEHATEPSIAHEWHLATFSLAANCFPRRTFGSYKKNAAAVCYDCLDKRVRITSHGQAHLKIDYVNFVTLTENVGCHFRVPVTGLMTKVHASL